MSESIFKYLDKAQGIDASQGADAAQDFLNEKLSKNKYTKQNTLDANGDPTVANATAEQGVKYKPETSTTSSDGIKGSMTAEEQRKEFGLIYDGEKEYTGDPGRLNDDKGNIWYKENGQIKYLGQVAGFTRGSTGVGGVKKSKDPNNSSDISSLFGDSNADMHKSTNSLLQQAHDEKNGPGHSNGFNSINDLSASLNYLRKEGAPAPEQPETVEVQPVEHSPEIKQAKARAQSYEDGIFSGKASEELYGDNKYVFDMNKGIDGIGTEGSIVDSDTALKSTENFLQSKKTDIMKKYQFKAV